MTGAVRVAGPRGELRVGAAELVVIAGPCLLESRELALRTAEGAAAACARLGLPYIFKSSYRKANRTSAASPQGPGLEAGLRLLAEVRAAVGAPVLTDVHSPEEARAAAAVADVLQVPAFLCRQSELLAACGATGKPVNIKKGQFMDPAGMARAAEKVRAAGAGGVLLTERGTFFGYGDLVVDFRSLAVMRESGCPVVFDVTHSLQRPSGPVTGGERRHAPALARAAVAAGVDALFLETHPDPDRALSDAATQWPLGGLEELLAGCARVRQAVGRG
ncbi:MAG TPA: 3-deoxy-8-phosphooctulonate synthase [Candidatus Saccharimonadales bacterium]|nr:3-deoxy-8-phosphooctulonate synthase [Candidatus Saccharimonadales bacterium]